MSGYLQHGRRHGPEGSDPILGLGNDWMIAGGTVSAASGVQTNIPFSSITYQTDDGSLYAELAGTVNSIEIKQVGSYLARALYVFPAGLTGNVLPDIVTGGSGGAVYAYNDNNSLPLGDFNGIGNPLIIFEQLVVVDDLSTPFGVYTTISQSTGATRTVNGYLEIFKLT